MTTTRESVEGLQVDLIEIREQVGTQLQGLVMRRYQETGVRVTDIYLSWQFDREAGWLLDVSVETSPRFVE